MPLLHLTPYTRESLLPAKGCTKKQEWTFVKGFWLKLKWVAQT